MKYEQPEVNATVVDGAEMVQVNVPDTAMTFGKYSKVEIGDKVSFLLACVQQLDIVFDVYQNGCCKRETPEGRGKGDGMRLSIKENTPIYYRNLPRC